MADAPLESPSSLSTRPVMPLTVLWRSPSWEERSPEGTCGGNDTCVWSPGAAALGGYTLWDADLGDGGETPANMNTQTGTVSLYYR